MALKSDQFAHFNARRAQNYQSMMKYFVSHEELHLELDGVDRHRHVSVRIDILFELRKGIL